MRPSLVVLDHVKWKKPPRPKKNKPRAGRNTAFYKEYISDSTMSEGDRLVQRRYFDYLADSFGIQVQADWYKKKFSDIKNAGGEVVMDKYFGRSLAKGLEILYPEYTWYFWLFGTIPRKLWTMSNQRKYMDWLADELGIQTQEDWYQINTRTIQKQYGDLLSFCYKGSIMKTIEAVYPEFEWYPWLGHKSPRRIFNWPENQKRYFDWLGDKLEIQSLSGWYKVNTYSLIGRKGLHKTHNALLQCLQKVYPDERFKPWLFNKTPQSFWTNLYNRRRYFDWLADELNIERTEDWYNYKLQDVVDRAGVSVVSLYNWSYKEALEDVYPELTFLPWMFQHVQEGFWDNKDNVHTYIKWAEEKLGITELSQWKKVSHRRIAELKGATLIIKNGGILPLLQRVYPDYKWDEEDFHKFQRKEEPSLLDTIRAVFAQELSLQTTVLTVS